MSELRKVTVTVKNYELHSSEDSGRLYKKVRMLDGSGKVFYYKNLIVPKYLERRGAFASDVPRIWFVKNIHRNAVILVAFETKDGAVEFDLDEVRQLSRSGFWAGVVIGVASIPAGIVISFATFGAGLLLIPFGLYQAYKQVFKIPAILSRKQLLQDFSQLGITVSEGWSR